MDPPSSPEEAIDFGSIFSQPVRKKSFVVPYNSSPFKHQIIPNPPDLEFLQSQPLPTQNHVSKPRKSFDLTYSGINNPEDIDILNPSPEDENSFLLSNRQAVNNAPEINSSQSFLSRRNLFDIRNDDVYKGNSNQSSQARISQKFQTPSKNQISTQQAVQLETPSNAVIPVSSLDQSNGNINLRSLSEIPEKFRKIFNFPYFNVAQSKVFDNVFYSDRPLVVCAPTGSGKTALFELAIVRMLLCSGGDANLEYKIVYMAPIKALCSERHQDWSTKFGSFGLKCTELTGDTDLDDFHVLQSSHIVLTTPEKWDSMTRKWKDNKSLVQSVRLFLIDEVHLLSDQSRGATMEAVVSRMKTVQKFIKKEVNKTRNNNQLMRIVAVSATIPNVEDIADWLTFDDCVAESYSMGDEYRPVNLRNVVLGYPCSENASDFKFDLSLNYKLSGVIQTYSENKPTIVFCSTRKGTTQAAITLTKDARFIMDAQHRGRLIQYSNSLHDSKLRDLVLYGVGYHHAGMDMADRKNIESMFVRGELPVLFCTSTLAMGVNLPAHLVVIKSTMHYVTGMYEEYSESQVLQMIGRAGRPQFDTSATAVIMTKVTTKGKYQALISGMQKIESSLHHHLTEHVNAEIVLNTITSVPMTNEWLKSTFLYKRMQRNPKHYGAPEGLTEDALGKKLQAMGLRALRSLQSLDLVEIKENSNVYPTETGKLMARYCIAFETVKSFTKIKGNEGIEELVDILAKCKEFEDITLRANEKRILNTLNKDKHRATIRFPMKNKIKTTDQKINCLIQAILGCLTINEFSLMQDVAKIFRSAQRVCRFLTEFLLTKGLYRAALNAVILCKCIRARLWENSKFVSRQLEKIGATMSAAMVNAGLTSLEKIENINPRQLELIVNRNPPFGSQVKDSLFALPKYDISIDQDEKYQKDTADLYLKITMLNYEQRAKFLKNKKLTHQHSCLLMIGDFTNNVSFKQRLMDSYFLQCGSWSRHIKVKRAQRSPELCVNLISSDYVGIDVQLTFTPHYLEGFYGSVQERKSTQISGNTGIPVKSSTDTQERKPCTHRCINKDWCGHQCCKYGVAVKQLKTNSNANNDINTEESLKNSKSVSKDQSTPKEGKRKVNVVDGLLENMYERSSSIPRTTAAKRVKVDSPFHQSSYFDDDDYDDDEADLILAIQPPSSSSSSSKLQSAFSYKPKRVDFKSYLREVNETENIKNAKQMPTTKNISTRNRALDPISSFAHLRSGSMSNVKEGPSDGGKYSGDTDDLYGDENIQHHVDYNFSLLDEDLGDESISSSFAPNNHKKQSSHTKKPDDNIIDLESIEDFDDDDYGDQICPEVFEENEYMSDDDELYNSYGKGRSDTNKDSSLLEDEADKRSKNSCRILDASITRDRTEKSHILTDPMQRFPSRSVNIAKSSSREQLDHCSMGTAKLKCLGSSESCRTVEKDNALQRNSYSNSCLPNNTVLSGVKASTNCFKAFSPATDIRKNGDSFGNFRDYSYSNNKVPEGRMLKHLKMPPPQTPGATDFATASEYGCFSKGIRENARRIGIPITPYVIRTNRDEEICTKTDKHLKEGVKMHAVQATSDVELNGNNVAYEGSRAQDSNLELGAALNKSGNISRSIPALSKPSYTNEISMKVVSNDYSKDRSNISIQASNSNTVVSQDSHLSIDSKQQVNKDFMKKPSLVQQNQIGGSFTVNWFVKDNRCQVEEDDFEFCD